MHLFRLTCLAALAALAACAMPPDGTSEQDVANFDAAVASIGCDLIDRGDYQAVELQTGLTDLQMQEMAAFRIEAGAAARLSNGGMRLTTGTCTPPEPTETEAPAEA